MKKSISLAILTLSAAAGMAQSPKAQLKMDEGKFAEALQIVNEAIANNEKDAAEATAKAQEKGKPVVLDKFNKKFAGLYNQSGTCYAQIFNPELMKAANQQPLDTMVFVNTLDAMVNAYTKSYVYDNMPDAKGKVKAKYDADNKRFIESCLDYYFYSAIFLNERGDKAGAGAQFKKHMLLPENPALADKKDSILLAKKENYEQSAYFNTLINYELKQWEEILATIDKGLSNKEYNHDLYLIKAEAVLQTTKDTAQYVGVLKDAIANVEKNQSFAESLLSIYYDKKDAMGAEATVDEILAKNPNSASAWYMKGCINLNLKQDFATARDCFGKVLAADPEHLLANANMAYAWMNDVATRRMNGEYKYIERKTVTEKIKAAYEAELAAVREFYSNARPYMEKVRELAPDRSKVWAPALQQIYFNLGMEDEAKQMDAIMESNH